VRGAERGTLDKCRDAPHDDDRWRGRWGIGSRRDRGDGLSDEKCSDLFGVIIFLRDDDLKCSATIGA